MASDHAAPTKPPESDARHDFACSASIRLLFPGRNLQYVEGIPPEEEASTHAARAHFLEESSSPSPTASDGEVAKGDAVADPDSDEDDEGAARGSTATSEGQAGKPNFGGLIFG